MLTITKLDKDNTPTPATIDSPFGTVKLDDGGTAEIEVKTTSGTLGFSNINVAANVAGDDFSARVFANISEDVDNLVYRQISSVSVTTDNAMAIIPPPNGNPQIFRHALKLEIDNDEGATTDRLFTFQMSLFESASIPGVKH